MSVIIKGLSALHSKVKRDIKAADNAIATLADKQEHAEHTHSLRRSIARTEYDEAVARAAKRFNATVAEADDDYNHQTAKLDAQSEGVQHKRRRLGRLNRHLSRALDEHEEDVKLNE